MNIETLKKLKTMYAHHYAIIKTDDGLSHEGIILSEDDEKDVFTLVRKPSNDVLVLYLGFDGNKDRMSMLDLSSIKSINVHINPDAI